MTDTSGPAFPSTWSKDVVIGNEGMTKREYAAIAAMQGLCANPALDWWEDRISKRAVQQADALLSELDKEEGK